MAPATELTREAVERRVRELGEWFHNLDLCGVQTAPQHYLGDYPAVKWRRFADALPTDLRGRTVLDIGCNAGFYSIEMKRRGVELEFHELSVYDIATLGERFDIVLFLGVFYHLRHPLLALDLIHEHVARDLLVFQSMQRGSAEIEPLEKDYAFAEVEVFDRPGFPKLHFIERRYAGDPTNWWAPNRACSEAMLRSAGFAVAARPEDEVFICRRQELPGGSRAVYPKTAEARCSKQ
jgi:tRNA (mo5U34)-methyltransferase